MSSLRYFDQIQYGSFDGLEVLVNPDDNSLWVLQRSIQALLGWDRLDSTGVRAKLKSASLSSMIGECERVASKSLQPSNSNGLAGVKLVNAVDTLGRKNKFKAIPLEFFNVVLLWQSREGNENASALLVAGFADSFRSIVLEQCGIKLSVTERNITIDRYLNWYHSFQDWVRDTHVAVYGSKPDNAYYQKMARLINDYLFAKYHFRCDRKANASTEELRVLENFQMAFMRTKMSKNRVDDPVLLMREYINAIDL